MNIPRLKCPFCRRALVLLVAAPFVLCCSFACFWIGAYEALARLAAAWKGTP